MNHSGGAQQRAGAVGQVSAAVVALDDRVDRRAPGALADAGGAPFVQAADERPGEARGERAPLGGREPATVDLLHLGERRAERRDVTLDDRREHRQEYDRRDAVGISGVRRGEGCECLCLGVAADTGVGVGYGEHAPPRCGEREARHERPGGIVAGVDATSRLDDEAAPVERPGSDGRPARPANGAGQVGRAGLDAVQRRERAPDGEGELGARPESGVRRNRPFDDDARSPVEAMTRDEPPREFRRTLGIGALDLDRACTRRGHPHQDPRGRRADAAVSSSGRAAQVEHAEMETGIRLHGDRGARAGSAGGDVAWYEVAHHDG